MDFILLRKYRQNRNDNILSARHITAAQISGIEAMKLDK
jgi:hypothetical protein